ncbi:MAG TPA: CatB-related O-acetyltransferase [Candidatus Paceibacterota bacterium]
MIFEGNNAIYNNTIILDSYLGYGSYVANQSNIKKTKIGRYCAIGDNVRTCLGLHPTSNFVSIHPAFFSLNKQAGFTFVDKQLFEEHKYIDNTKKYVVEIGNDVWIGNNVLIMDGIKIGDGAVIAAGAVITKDVAPYSIVGGVPAKHIKYRFEQEDIDFLLQFKWWEKSPEWIKKNASAFISINLFRNI